jgi:bacterioferritin-associated ferredoxin
MQPDDELCMCFHVSWRKVINYIRIHKVRLPSQLSECQGAGTGCGWCRIFMQQLVERIDHSQGPTDDLEEWLAAQMPAAQAYARRRADYIANGKKHT